MSDPAKLTSQDLLKREESNLRRDIHTHLEPPGICTIPIALWREQNGWAALGGPADGKLIIDVSLGVGGTLEDLCI